MDKTIQVMQAQKIMSRAKFCDFAPDCVHLCFSHKVQNGLPYTLPGAPHSTTQEADSPNCSTPMQKVVVAVPQILKVFSRVFIYKFHKKIVLDFLTLSISHSVSLDMLNNFRFHVYAQKSLSHFHTLSLSHSHSLIHSFSTC